MATDDEHARGLLSAIAGRDEAAMAAFYKLFGRQVYAFALRQLSNPDEAEETVIETMMEVWNAAGRFAGQSQARTWLFGIARHRALDKLRRRGRNEWVDIDEMGETLADENDESGFERLAREQRAEHVAHCLERLSPEHRECLHLVFFEEMGLAEVAELQQVPEGTVKTRVFHAKKNLKRCLERRLEHD
ncbi:MAG TPA: sigma-70 family RNA polymerase sigma factor [Pelomicrobium sp.]|nr:sigma-70 family RNA polymerase sigma factor [Pelomicrobium sp.]